MKCIATTYFVDLIRRPSAIRAITQKLDNEGVHATTVFNVYEALFGAYSLKDEDKRKKAKAKLNKAISRLEVLKLKRLISVCGDALIDSEMLHDE